MRCQACDYPLWNLKARQCPECGRPFLPSQFEFVPNSVRFGCPDCGQDYYGTGERGHLVPDRFTCVRCARPLAMDEMVLLPTEGVVEEQTRIDRMPWVERSKIGFFRAWAGTIWRVMFNPGQLARVTPPNASAFGAWWFGVLTLSASIMFTVAPMVILMLFAAPGRGMALPMVTSILGLGLGAAVLAAVLLLLWGGLAHLVLLSTGRTPFGLGTTVRTVCYASGSGILLAIPCLGAQFGWLAGWIWPTISGAIMLRHTQRAGGLRATFAMLSGPILMLLLSVGLFTLAILPAISASQGAFAAARTSATQGMISSPLAALTAYAGQHGAYPAHPFTLVANGNLLAAELTPTPFGARNLTRPPSVLDRFTLMPEAQRAALARQLESSVQPGDAATRLGDFVFTYHGLDPAAADPGLWLVIYDPPPAARDFEGNPAPLVAATAGGSIQVIPRDQFAAALKTQNALRAGLPQIPDPGAVKDPGDDSSN